MQRKRGAGRKLAETTQKHFLPMISASGDKAGILTPPRASSLGPLSIPQRRPGEGGSCTGNAPAGDAKGQDRFGLEGHGSAMDPLWTRGVGVL